jgi:hypothetical protein
MTIRAFGISMLSAAIAIGAYAQDTARGIVFNDANGNGTYDATEHGIAGVGVSNGKDVVLTDSDGRYELSLPPDSIAFVIKPSNWRTPLDENQLPRFYYSHKPDGSPASEFAGVAPTGELPDSIDFPLYPQEEPGQFKAIFFGDPQPRNVEEINYIAHDIVEELIGYDAAFGVTLGDIVFDDLSIFPVLNGVIGQIGTPWYNVIGNHDLNFDSEDDRNSDETFERIYGPSYYSYNYGAVHFVVMDNVAWEGDGYHGEFGETQLAFLRNNLALVDNDTLVVLMMHIPLPGVDDRAAFLDAINGRPNVFSISAHWHRQGTFFVGKEAEELGDHFHLVHGTISGSWWSGMKDEWNIPHTMMSDGTPNGYSIATFDGTQYSLRYKAARRPADFQMSIFAPDEVAAAQAANHDVVVNVFMGSSQSTVEMRLGDGGWTKMTLTEREDPYYLLLKEREEKLPEGLARRLPDPRPSTHIWVAPIPADPPVGTHVIHVRTTDMFGQTFTGQRIIRVVE